MEDRYFLIVEDFTKGGKADFRPGPSEHEFGTVNEKRIYYDFPDQLYETDFIFMADSSVIHIR